MGDFIDITSTTIEYEYNNEKYSVTAEENDIVVFCIYENVDYQEEVEMDPQVDLEYWVGALLFHYENDLDVCWTEADYRRAAQICLVEDRVLEAKHLEKICEISSEWGVEPASYVKCLRNLDLHNASKNADFSFKEGAD